VPCDGDVLKNVIGIHDPADHIMTSI
jgi:hypothetical protein